MSLLIFICVLNFLLGSEIIFSLPEHPLEGLLFEKLNLFESLIPKDDFPVCAFNANNNFYYRSCTILF